MNRSALLDRPGAVNAHFERHAMRQEIKFALCAGRDKVPLQLTEFPFPLD